MKGKLQAKRAARKNKKSKEKFDEAEAYNKNLSPEARLHYLENERADKDGVSMYGKGPNLEPITTSIIAGAKVAAVALPVIGPPAAKLGKKALSGLETLGAGEGFNKGFNMKNKDAFKDLSKGVGKIAKTDTGKMIKKEGVKLLDKTVKSIDGAKMNGKKKGPNAMGKKEKRSAIAGAIIGGLTGGVNPLGAIAGGLAGKAFGKGRDRKEAEEGAGANMMGNSISKHMGGRGANMYGEGPNAIGGKLLGGSGGAAGGAAGGGVAGGGIGAAIGGAAGVLAAPLTFGLSIPAGAAIGGAAGAAAGAAGGGAAGALGGAGVGHVRDKMKEKKRNKRRAAKAGVVNTEGKKPMMKGKKGK